MDIADIFGISDISLHSCHMFFVHVVPEKLPCCSYRRGASCLWKHGAPQARPMVQHLPLKLPQARHGHLSSHRQCKNAFSCSLYRYVQMTYRYLIIDDLHRSYCDYWCSHCESSSPMYPITDFSSHIYIIHLIWEYLRSQGRMPKTCEPWITWTSPDWVLSSDIDGTLFGICRMLGKDSLALHWIWNCLGMGSTALRAACRCFNVTKRMMLILAHMRSSFDWLLLHFLSDLGLFENGLQRSSSKSWCRFKIAINQGV